MFEQILNYLLWKRVEFYITMDDYFEKLFAKFNTLSDEEFEELLLDLEITDCPSIIGNDTIDLSKSSVKIKQANEKQQ